jgi:hypothetical protein
MTVSRSGTILDFGGRSVSAPALEPIQNDIRHGVHTHEILGASDEFIAADKRIHEELKAMRKQAAPAP